jgi:alkylation response protein AidB-like acyl-CoA dehydrogenase
MTTIEHPSARLDPEVARQLSAFAHEAEMSGDLHPSQLALIHSHKWFKMFIPKSYGGLGFTLPEVVRLEESLAWADGSTAWVITLCAGAGWFVGFADESILKEFFTGDKLCVAGSGSATGTAEITNDGYLINGSWPFASGSLHATAFTVNCVIQRDGESQLNADGTKRVLSFILKPDEVTVNKTWNAMGMVATASHAFTVRNIHVSNKRCFEIHPSAVRIENPVYRFPFLQLAETTLVANIAGLTMRFLDLAIDSANEPETSNGTSMCAGTVRRHLTVVNELRTEVFVNLDEAWQQLLEHNEVTEEKLHDITHTCHALAHACRAAINEIYPLCGMEALPRESERNRVWRNIHTALSHALFRKRMAVAAR